MENSLFLERYFSNLKLMPGLLYSWEPAIRFELGDPNEHDNKKYIAGSNERAATLYNNLHRPDDECIIVMDVLEVDLKRKNLTPFLNRSQHFRIDMTTYEMEEILIYRFEIACKADEIAVLKLLRAVVNSDLGVKPNIPHRVYILNKRTQTIFHVYDDRGCDVLGSNVETLRPLYEQYNDWILDYDREAITRMFKG
ncbi:DUF3885 domain-containing protein [Solibacillus merdavium]|uniref:DUF3885 domain-containing protein n=1 Tax=Solibacillus merdavium TaxID=2762218 RepID=A0ABR8XM44_9BACL|nr:DUF3885 domain-containing protein [Solibacillus merdavium]MBD8033005.1 DUF3885 domain-containing protein [Solibacillus merdavium]